MSIKKIITGLALLMLMSSGAANADWGDVYYCQMTNFIEVKPNGDLTNYKLEKFQFKLDQTKNAMELVLASSASVVALAKKMAKPYTKTVTRTISVPKTKVIKQPVQQPSKSSANDAARTAIKPTMPQKPLPHQQSG